MKTIWKYSHQVTDSFWENIPSGAKILHVNEQHDQICIWCELETMEPIEPRHFRVFGTGHEITSDKTLNYLGTVHIRGLVWHLYEETSIQ